MHLSNEWIDVDSVCRTEMAGPLKRASNLLYSYQYMHVLSLFYKNTCAMKNIILCLTGCGYLLANNGRYHVYHLAIICLIVLAGSNFLS